MCGGVIVCFTQYYKKNDLEAETPHRFLIAAARPETWYTGICYAPRLRRLGRNPHCIIAQIVVYYTGVYTRRRL